MVQGFGQTALRSGAFAMVAAIVLGAGTANAQQPPGSFVVSFEGGMVNVQANEFKPNERVGVAIKVDGKQVDLTAEAGPGGDFGLHSNLQVRAGQHVDVETRGNQGTTIAATTVVPADVGQYRPIVTLSGPAALPQAGGLPSFALPMTAAIGLVALTGGLIWGRRQVRR